MSPQSEVQRVLFVIAGGRAPTLVGGPYRSEADLTAGIIRAINKDPRLADPGATRSMRSPSGAGGRGCRTSLADSWTSSAGSPGVRPQTIPSG